MTDTTELIAPASGADENTRLTGGLTALRVAELQALAGSLGVSGTAKMRKSDLVSAIKAHQAGGRSTNSNTTSNGTTSNGTTSNGTTSNGTASNASTNGSADAAPAERPARVSRRAARPASAPSSLASTDASAEAAAESAAGSTTVAGTVNGSVNGSVKESAHDTAHGDADNNGRETSNGALNGDTHTESAPEAHSGERYQDRRGDRQDDRRADSRQDRTDNRSDNRGSDNRANERSGRDNRNDRGGESRDTRGNDRTDSRSDNRGNDRTDNRGNDRSTGNGQRDNGQRDNGQRDNGQRDNGQRDNDRSNTNNQRDNGQRDNDRSNTNNQRDNGPRDNGPRDNGGPRDDDERGGRRRSRQRYRDRKRRGDGDGESYTDHQDFGSSSHTSVDDDDVLVPVAGILDVLDNYAFIRTSGYLPGPNDVYVPLGIVKKNGLRKGDAVTGAVRTLREGETIPARQKYNALVRLDSVNGGSPDESGSRVEFGKLTPLYPQERLRLETESNILTTRIIDLVAPIGKGQRGLIVSPPKAGKTLILQAIANAIAINNPEAHLMIVLVDERPEEVTDMQRTVKGEVIASTFDRPAEDHTTVAELAIERAKRLVELGHDVVVLLDSITRLGRAYNLAAPASGRILSGGVDSSALYPPKRFFGAARNIENGGSLTILATALVETGSKMDEVIFEEFKGTGNMELRLSRTLADRRIFPAVDVNPSGTRREEILMAPDELKITWRLRRVLAALDQQQGIELLLDRLKKTRNNVEFLMQVQKTSTIAGADED